MFFSEFSITALHYLSKCDNVKDNIVEMQLICDLKTLRNNESYTEKCVLGKRDGINGK